MCCVFAFSDNNLLSSVWKFDFTAGLFVLHLQHESDIVWASSRPSMPSIASACQSDAPDISMRRIFHLREHIRDTEIWYSCANVLSSEIRADEITWPDGSLENCNSEAPVPVKADICGWVSVWGRGGKSVSAEFPSCEAGKALHSSFLTVLDWK